MNFSRDKEAKLIELVSRNPELFDLSNKDYKNIVLRDQIWKKIAYVLDGKTGE